jgi:hypothetical protein
MNMPNTVMFKNITITEHKQGFCTFCDKSATKIITRTSIYTGNRQIIPVCNCCFKEEIKGIRKYMRREAD